MSADFIGTFIPMPTITKDQALARLAAMTDDACVDAYINGYGFDPEDGEDARDTLAGAVVEFYDEIVDGGSTEVGLWTIGGQRYLVSGGLSWGDWPTEACQVIEIMLALGVTIDPD